MKLPIIFQKQAQSFRCVLCHFLLNQNKYTPNALENVKKPTRSPTTPIHTNLAANARDGIEMASAKPTLTRLETRAVEEDSRSVMG